MLWLVYEFNSLFTSLTDQCSTVPVEHTVFLGYSLCQEVLFKYFALDSETAGGTCIVQSLSITWRFLMATYFSICEFFSNIKEIPARMFSLFDLSCMSARGMEGGLNFKQRNSLSEFLFRSVWLNRVSTSFLKCGRMPVFPLPHCFRSNVDRPCNCCCSPRLQLAIRRRQSWSVTTGLVPPVIRRLSLHMLVYLTNLR